MAEGEPRIDPARREAYIRLRRSGLNKAAACREARISRNSANKLERCQPEGWLGRRGPARRILAEEEIPDPVAPGSVVSSAAEALEDFSLFRRRYLGRTTSPWQEDAARRMLGYLESPYREYVVVNAPPGPGKSTLFTHDLPAWLICRNRRIRIMIGSRNSNMAAKYVGRIRRTLERRGPAVPPDDQVARGLATVPEAILIEDYGRFAPKTRLEEVWTRRGFVVAQFDDETVSDKENTCEAFGFDTTYLGGRYDIVVWDDLVETRTARSQEARTKLAEDYEAEAETRLDPGGLLVLQGQRISSHDLYRHCLDQRVPIWWDDPDAEDLLARAIDRPDADEVGNPWLSDATIALDRESHVDLAARKKMVHSDDIAGYRPRYHHITYPAHFEDRCKGLHRISDPPVDPSSATSRGCLLDPKRLPWPELLGHMAQNPLKYRVLYQQEDTDEANVLVRRAWVDGGRDPDTGESFPGCVDHERWALPGLAHVVHLDRSLYWPDRAPPRIRSLLSMDPSPSRYWAIQHWLWDPDTSDHWLLDTLRQPLGANEILDWNVATNTYTGVLEEWWQRSVAIEARITHVTVEVNVAQKWLLQYDHAKRWARERSVTFVPHTTGVNKTDMDKGVESTQGHWRYGRIHLPYHPTRGKPVADLLINEALHWPEGMTDDQVMAHWFVCLRAPALYPHREHRPTLLRRPSWLRRPEHQEPPVPAVLRR